jgi:hypothetical protein
MVKKAYECYFSRKAETKTTKWAPHVCCVSCATNLREWLHNKGHSMPFALPMILREPTDHLTDCYFCIVPPLWHGITQKKRWTVTYPNISFAIQMVPHTEDIPVPVPPQQYILYSDEEPTENQEKTPQPSTSTDVDLTADLQFKKFYRITQQELNDLTWDLDLPNSKAKLLASRLQLQNLLEKNVQISVYCKRHKDIVQLFKMEGRSCCLN